MDEKTLNTLEFPKVLEKLAGYAAFSASAALARALQPTTHLEVAHARLARTTEARQLLSINDLISVGGSTDIRPAVDLAARGGVLDPADLLAVKTVLQVGRNLSRTLEKSVTDYPHLAGIMHQVPLPVGLIEAISHCISDQNEVVDTASDKLLSLRRAVKTTHERLQSKLERLINDPHNAPLLQDPIITLRGGRYVIPLRADSKGKLRAIVHDQSASGATFFVEPIGTVDLNNAWQEAMLAERDEVRRILAELSAQVGEHKDELDALLHALAEFDLALACAKYAEDLRAVEPILLPFRKPGKEKHPGSTIKVQEARHPLLDPATVVPIDVVLDEETYALVITGPNTGGKTVTLKTIGLFVLMAQSGLHLPARSGSEISLFTDVLADIGDEQSIEQSLSTFSGHIRNIVRILLKATHTTLVLLDELGAGTDPQEGSALARAILDSLVQRTIPCMVATHYPELKTYAHSTPGVVNASLEFNLKTLRPTYHLTIGLPGRSNALAIAKRLGLDPGIIEGARSLLDPNDLRAEDMLDEIHRQRDLARRARGDADRTRFQTEKLQADLLQKLEGIEEERRRVLEEAREQAEAEVEEVRLELEAVRRELARSKQPLEVLRPLQEQVETLQEMTAKPVRRKVVKEPISRPLRVGDKVRLSDLSQEGVITTLGAEDADVQVGNLRLRVKVSELQLAGSEKIEVAATPAAVKLAGQSNPLYPSPGMELDLRGQRAEDALEALDRYLDSASMAGLPFVRIIHGKGTGRLRQVIREALKESRLVSKTEPGGEKEGGDGVTIARLRED